MKAAAEFHAAASLNAVGVDGWALIVATDPVEILARQALAELTAREVEQRDEALARRIANAVGKLFK